MSITNTVQKARTNLLGLVSGQGTSPFDINPKAKAPNQSTAAGPVYKPAPLVAQSAPKQSAPTQGLMGTQPSPQVAAASTPSYSGYQTPPTQAYSQQSSGLMNTPGQSATPVAAQPTRGVISYPGFVQDLAGASRPNAAQTGLIGDLAGVGRENQAIAQEARNIASKYGGLIAQTGALGAGKVASDLSTGTSVVGEGNAAIASQSASQRMSALAAAQQAELAGTGQQLTAQSQYANALGTALGGANTQQAQMISGLGSAAGFAQPQVTAVGQTSFDPLTGQFAGGVGGIPPEVMQMYANMAVTGQYSAIPSIITSNPILAAQLNVAAKALNPNFTPVAAQGASGVLANLPALQSAETASEGIKNSIISFLNANPQLNQSNAALLNAAQQWVQGKQLTDPKYQTLFNYLNEYTNTLAPILGVGGNPTNLKTQIASDFVNAAASGQSIAEVLNATSALAKNKLLDMQSGALGGGTNVPTPYAGGAATGANDQGWGWNI
jgi:hypothetical protein